MKKAGDLDSNQVRVYLKFKGRLDADGNVTDLTGRVLGKSDREGLIRNSAGEGIGKREKSLNELRSEYSLPGL